MKTKFFTLLLVIVASTTMLFAQGGTCGQNLTWTITDGVLVISGTGPMTNYSQNSIRPWTSYSFNSVVVSEGVTTIGDYAFYFCSSLSSVTIANSVTKIGECAFRTTGLTEVMLPNSVTDVGYRAFFNIPSTSPIYNSHVFAFLPMVYEGEYVIPEGIEIIAGGAFSDCSNLTSIIIPNSVLEIGREAFGWCSGITSLTIPNSVKKISEKAFAGCANISSVTMSQNVTDFGEDPFLNCTNLPITNNVRYADTYLIETIDKSLSTYILLQGTKWIGSNAFKNCYNLTHITIPDSVVGIGNNAFLNCNSLQSINIPHKVISIGTNAYGGCSALSVISLNSNAIANTSNLLKSTFGTQVTKFVIGDSVTHIGANAFNGYTSLNTITIGNNVESIGKYAFKGCSGLSSVSIPNNVTKIGDNIFDNCNNIITPIYNSSNFVMLPISYSGVYAIQSGIVNICGGAFENCVNLSQVIIPNTVTTIRPNAFYNCVGLKSVNLPHGIEYIDNNAFYGCASLDSIIIPSTVTSLGNDAFTNCRALTFIDIPSTVSYSTMRISSNYKNLIRVEAPSWFFNVEESGLSECPRGMESITINRGEIFDNAFDVISRSYKTLKYLNLANVTNAEITDEAFKGYYNLTTLALPSNLEHIGYMSVADCKSLQSIFIPASVEEIDNSAFENCRSLKTITFGGQAASSPRRFNSSTTSDCQLQRIGNWAFYNCHELQNLTIPEGVTEIGDGAFYGCVYLEDLSLPASVQTIGDNTFALCYKLQRIEVNAPVPPSIQAKTFFDVKRQIPVYVPDEAVAAYENDTYWQEFDIQGVSQMPTAIGNISDKQNNRASKLLRDGQILILRGNHTYTLTGAEVK